MSAAGHQLQAVECQGCSAVFAVPQAFFDARVADRAVFFCPSGHQIRLGVESSNDRLLREVTAQLDLATQALGVAREEHDALLAANLRLADETLALQRTVVNHLMGSATAQEET